MAEIVAESGGRLLVLTRREADRNHDRGRIYDPQSGHWWPEQLIHQVLKHGYWDEPASEETRRRYAALALPEDFQGPPR